MSDFLENKTILIISPEAWGPVKVSKHHYATYLSKKNKVYFLNPSKKSRLKNFKFEITIEELSPTLSLINYSNLLPKLNSLPKSIQYLIYKYQGKKIQQFIASKIDIVWTFDPYRYWDQRIWQDAFKIYHSVDVHFSKGFEHILAASSNLVFINSEILRANLMQHNPHIYKINHGADIDALAQTHTITPYLPGYNCYKAGLVCNFNNNIDYLLIRSIAKANPTIDFIMVGPYKSNNLGNTHNQIDDEIEQTKAMNNVFFIGSIESESIITYLQLFDINLVLYKESKTWSQSNTTLDGIIINPHKIMAYLYSGKLIVSTYIHEYATGYDDIILMSNKNNEIVQLVSSAVERLSYFNSPELRNKRTSIAIENSYDNQLKKIERIIDNLGNK